MVTVELNSENVQSEIEFHHSGYKLYYETEVSVNAVLVKSNFKENLTFKPEEQIMCLQ